MAPYSKCKHLYLDVLWLFSWNRIEDKNRRKIYAKWLYEKNHWITFTITGLILSNVATHIFMKRWYIINPLRSLAGTMTLEFAIQPYMKQFYQDYHENFIINLIWLLTNIPLIIYFFWTSWWIEQTEETLKPTD